MFLRGITLSLAALLAIGVLGTAAEAEQRKPPPPPPEDSYSGPPLLRYVPGFRILFGDYAMSEEEYDRRYGKADNFDESYYEPQPAPPPKQKKKAAVTPQKPAAAASTAATAKAGATAADAKVAPPQKTASATPKPAAGGLSCEKAASVIAGYGFSDVVPASCAGKLYSFNAKRDGKPFAIKFNSASGELAEVKKLP